MFRSFNLAVAVVLTCVWPVRAEQFERGPIPGGGETFYASFDDGPRPDAGIGFLAMHSHNELKAAERDAAFTFVDGPSGKALDLRPDRPMPSGRGRRESPNAMAGCPFQGHLCNRVGTLSFWFRATKGPPTVFVISQSNDNIGGPRLIELSSRRGLRAAKRDYSYLQLGPALEGVDDGKWHHAAIVWDEFQGLRLHLDGKEIKSNWGKSAYQTGYLSVGSLNLAGATFDELRVFDLALSGEQIEALARGNRQLADLRIEHAAVGASHRLEHLGWQGAPDEAFVPSHGPTLIRRAEVADAKALLISGWRGVDGRHDSVWPIRYHGYQYLGGGGLHLKLAPDQQFNFVRVTGAIDAAVLATGDAWTRPEGQAGDSHSAADSAELARLTGERFVMNYPLAAPSNAPAVTVYPEKDRKYYRGTYRQLHDIALLDVSEGESASHPEVLKTYLTPQAPATVAGDNRVRLVNWYRADEREASLCAVRAPEPSEVAVEPLRFHHVMLPPQPGDLPLSAVRLKLQVDGWEPGNTVDLRVHDPFNLWRELIDVDVRMQQAGAVDLALEFPPTILPKETELWITLLSRQAGRIRCGPGGSTVTLHGPRMEEASRSYLTWQHRLLKDTFAALSEPRPWGHNTFDDTFLRVALPVYDNIARIVWDLHRRFPGDRPTCGYMLFTHPQEGAYWQALPANLPEDPTVPRWALLQKELLGQFLYYVHWWIDNRQTPNGELGNFWGDDTDLIGDWVAPSLICDPDGKIKRSQRLVADHTWKTLIRNGLNVRWTDALHAYEDGNNAQPYAALLDYGNPVLWERLLATARRYDGFLLTPPVDGKREMAGNYYCDEKVGWEGSWEKLYHMHLIFGAGHTLSWYNGNRRLTQMMIELVDGTERLRDSVPSVQHSVYLQTRDPRFALRFRDYAQNAVWARLMNLTAADVDRSALKELIDYRFETCHTNGLGNGATDALKKYAAWHYTRDKSHLVPALEYLWKQTYYTMPLRTKTEQSGDRVAVFKNLTDCMYLGGFPGARAHIVPTHAVSYEGLSPEFAAMVLDDTPELLRWVGLNFEDGPQTGKLRVWNLAPGTYAVRTGVDLDGDDRIDGAGEKLTLDLKRYETIPVTLPSRRLYVVEARRLRKDVPLYERPDLAVTHEDANREAGKLTVVVHNLGCLRSGPFTVAVEDPSGRTVAVREHPGLEGVADLRDKRVSLDFENLPPHGTLRVSVAGPDREITEVNNTARIASP